MPDAPSVEAHETEELEFEVVLLGGEAIGAAEAGPGDPQHPQPSHDANVHAREGHAHGGEEAGMSADAPREREAEGMEDPRDRGVGA